MATSRTHKQCCKSAWLDYKTAKHVVLLLRFLLQQVFHQKRWATALPASSDSYPNPNKAAYNIITETVNRNT